jgi:hypothetical protein
MDKSADLSNDNVHYSLINFQFSAAGGKNREESTSNGREIERLEDGKNS